MTEKQARDAGYKVKTGKFPFVGNSKATILNNHGGFIKVVSDEKFGEVLGIHIIGPLATEILSEAATVLNLEGTIDDMMNMVHAHPTFWEALGDSHGRGLTSFWLGLAAAATGDDATAASHYSNALQLLAVAGDVHLAGIVHCHRGVTAWRLGELASSFSDVADFACLITGIYAGRAVTLAITIQHD